MTIAQELRAMIRKKFALFLLDWSAAERLQRRIREIADAVENLEVECDGLKAELTKMKVQYSECLESHQKQNAEVAAVEDICAQFEGTGNGYTLQDWVQEVIDKLQKEGRDAR